MGTTQLTVFHVKKKEARNQFSRKLGKTNFHEIPFRCDSSPKRTQLGMIIKTRTYDPKYLVEGNGWL